MNLRPHFITNIIISGQQGEQWLKDLPCLLEKLSYEWKLKLLNPLSNLSFHFIALMENSEKRNFILKAPVTADGLKNVINWLKSFQGITPILYEHNMTYDAFLMDYIEPSTPLADWIKEKDDEGFRLMFASLISVSI